MRMGWRGAQESKVPGELGEGLWSGSRSLAAEQE
jgi:hypothetical protein